MNTGSSTGSAIDRENPWPGLASFTEESREFFFGREREQDELARLVRRQTLTVLFGQSGLGKSSLIQAGLFPALRDADFLPLYLRLDHDPASPPLAEQVKTALTAAFAAVKAEAPAFRADETLWEYFHRKDVDVWSAKNRLLTPVLAFDQFEEIFTLGRATDAARERSRAFLTELTGLVENHAPPAVQAKLDRGELEPARFNFEKPSCQVILSLREDYLPDLEGLKQEMPALIHNRMRLKRLNGAQALEIVTKPGAHLVGDGVAEKIVEFVAGSRGGSAERLAELDVEPPLLSVICRELNERRRTLGQDKITGDLVSGNRREILHDFYARSVADLPEAMRDFIEDRLLTKSGFRDNLALETALEFPGVTRPLVDTLVARRLLRIEDRVGVQRVELTHDVLAEVVRNARDAHRQQLELAAAMRRTQRQYWIIAGLAAAVCALLIGAVFGIRAQRRAEQLAHDEAVRSSRTDFILGSRLLEERKSSEGLAYLVRAARSDPENYLAGPRLVSALAFRSFAEPVGRPIAVTDEIFYSLYAEDGDRVLTWAKGEFGYWNLKTGELLRKTSAPRVGRGDIAINKNRRLVAAQDNGAVTVWDMATGTKLIGPLQHPQRVMSMDFSPNDRWLVTACADQQMRVWDIRSGEITGTAPYVTGDVAYFAISPDSSRVVTTGSGFRFWRLPDAAPLSEPVPIRGGAVEFNKDGTLIAVMHGSNPQGGAQFYDVATSAAVGARMTQGGQNAQVRFSHDGTKCVTASSDGTARLWEVPSGKPLHPPLQHGFDVEGVKFSSDDRQLVTQAGDGVVRVWQVESGRLALEPLRGIDCFYLDTHPSRAEIVIASSDGKMRRWSIAPSEIVPMEIPTDPERINIQRDAGGALTAWEIYPTQMQQVDLLSAQRIGGVIEFPARMTRSVLSPNAQLLAGHVGDDLELWQLGGTEIRRRSLGPWTNNGSMSFSPNSAYLVRSIQDSGDFTAWDTNTGEVLVGPLKDLTVARTRIIAPFSRTNRYVIAENVPDGVVVLVDLVARKTGVPIRNGSSIWGAAIDPTEQFVALGDSVGVIRLWDWKTGTRIGEPFVSRRAIIRGQSFTPEGELMAWNRQEICLWDLKTRKPVIPSMPAGIDAITAILSADGTRIASFATTGGEIRVFDRESGALAAEPILGATSNAANPITFSADSRFILSSSPSPTTARPSNGLCLWPVPPRSSGKPVPEWLLRLATALVGGEIDARGVFKDRIQEAGTFDALRAELAGLPKDAPYADWGRWILADRATRPVAPGFSLTRAEIEQRTRELATAARSP